ncbi:hypothetical protein ACWD62_42450 [Streptomyces sp. NPDC005146]
MLLRTTFAPRWQVLISAKTDSISQAVVVWRSGAAGVFELVGEDADLYQVSFRRVGAGVDVGEP